MTGPLFFPEALAEYEDAVVYYETQATNLGARLILEFDQTLALAMEFPALGMRVDGTPDKYDLRQRLLPTFGIKLIYTIQGDTFIVVAVFHGSRRPGYWFRRLENLH